MIQSLTPRDLRFLPEDDLRLYLKDVGRTRPLGRREERELLARIRAGDRRALNALVQANLRFVVAVALNYRNRGVPLGDLINEGNLGLLRAAEKFEPGEDVKFITYAVWWIRQGILAALRRRYRQQVEATSAELLDTLSDSGAFAADAESDRQLTRKHARAAVDSLPVREREVLRRFFGFDTGQADTLETIGQDLGLSRERVRQIKDAGLSRLRRSDRLQELLAARDWSAEAA